MVANAPLRPDQTESPAVPPPEAPKKNSRVGWIVAGAVGLLLVAVIASQNSDSTPRTGGNTVVDQLACPDLEGAAGYTRDAIGHSQDSLTGVQAMDMDSAANDLDAAGDDYDAIAAIFVDFPTESGPAAEVANDYHSAADDLRAFNINGATGHIQDATMHLDQGTAAAKALMDDPRMAEACG